MVLWDIMVAFSRANLLGYGGGPSVIPLIKTEVVENFRWLSNEEFADALAIGNTLPGPIATKMAAYIGYQVAGIAGSLVGLVATVLPTAVLMMALAALLFRYKDSGVVNGMIRGAKPVVWVLFLLLVIQFLPFVRPDKAGWVPAAIAVSAFVAAYYFNVNQAVIIAGSILLGGLFLR